MIERIMTEAARRSEQAELFSCRFETTPVRFQNNRMAGIDTREGEVFALRVIAGGRVGFASATGLPDPVQLVDQALAVAACGGEARGGFAGPVRPRDLELHDPAVLRLSLEDMTSIGRDMIEALLAYDGNIQAGVSVTRQSEQVTVVTTAGAHASYPRTRLSLAVNAELIEGNNFLELSEAETRTDDGIDHRQMVDLLIARLRRAQHNVDIASGTYPAVLAPSALFPVLMRFIACLEGKGVETGVSPWADMTGTRLLDPRVTLRDDPWHEGAWRSAPIDDEGTATRPRALIDQGVLSGFMLDLASARALGLAPTGNGFRDPTGGRRPPGPTPSSLILEPGTESLAVMLGQMKDGILIEEMMGAWAGNLYTGEVSGNVVMGLLVRDGQPVGRVKNAMASFNAFDSFRDGLVGLSVEQGWCLGYPSFLEWDGLVPYVWLDAVNVAAGK